MYPIGDPTPDLNSQQRHDIKVHRFVRLQPQLLRRDEAKGPEAERHYDTNGKPFLRAKSRCTG